MYASHVKYKVLSKIQFESAYGSFLYAHAVAILLAWIKLTWLQVDSITSSRRVLTAKSVERLSIQ